MASKGAANLEGYSTQLLTRSATQKEARASCTSAADASWASSQFMPPATTAMTSATAMCAYHRHRSLGVSSSVGAAKQGYEGFTVQSASASLAGDPCSMGDGGVRIVLPAKA